MKILLKFSLLFVMLLTLIACDMEKMEADRIDQMELDPAQRAIAEALIEGYKKEINSKTLQSREYVRAQCYALSSKMPTHYHEIHIAYLKDYTKIDLSYYEWFRNHGYDDGTAKRIGDWVLAAWEECTFDALAKKAFRGLTSSNE